MQILYFNHLCIKHRMISFPIVETTEKFNSIAVCDESFGLYTHFTNDRDVFEYNNSHREFNGKILSPFKRDRF